MRAKFGASGGLNGNVRMGGVGSSCGSEGGNGALLSSLGSSAGAGLSHLASASSWLLSSATETAKTAYSTGVQLSARAVSGRSDLSADMQSHQQDPHDLSDLLNSLEPGAVRQTSSGSGPTVVREALPNPTPAPSSSIAAPAVHVTASSGSTALAGRKKVAAAKVKDDSWDDWGDEKW